MVFRFVSIILHHRIPALSSRNGCTVCGGGIMPGEPQPRCKIRTLTLNQVKKFVVGFPDAGKEGLKHFQFNFWPKNCSCYASQEHGLEAKERVKNAAIKGLRNIFKRRHPFTLFLQTLNHMQPLYIILNGIVNCALEIILL